MLTYSRATSLRASVMGRPWVLMVVTDDARLAATGFEAEELLMRAGALFLSVRSVGDIKDDGVNGL